MSRYTHCSTANSGKILNPLYYHHQAPGRRVSGGEKGGAPGGSGTAGSTHPPPIPGGSQGHSNPVIGARLSYPLHIDASPSHSFGPPSSPPSLRDLPNPEELSAERLNLYLDRNEGDLDNIDEENEDQTKKSPKERWKKRLRIMLPHVGLVLLSAMYTLLGAAVFHNVEMPYEMQLRNETCTRVTTFKKETIERLWRLRQERFTEFERTAEDAMDHIIRDVFHDYTKELHDSR
ncbi:unnamed protein product, partial [Mesorhabditis belari]|uniref:Uncharacterized protein n=1 Tax=Mesorhabditis belari TaxID=2138241 RepID=A0AAF3JCA9_9BILA